MWFDVAPKKSWTSLWYDYVICFACGAIRRIDADCTVCGDPLPASGFSQVSTTVGNQVRTTTTFMGAEGRYEDYVYLSLMEREWKRPIGENDSLFGLSNGNGPSARAAIVLTFWTYFESRIERLLRSAMRSVPEELTEELLRRNFFIGVRLDRFYKILFKSTYSADLSKLGFDDVAVHLEKVQKLRNAFTHGSPQAIDDLLVTEVVEKLKIEHEAWVAVYNMRRVSLNSK
jgi:hypothetical protein